MMLKKVLKLYFVIVIVWIVLLLTLLRGFKNGALDFFNDIKINKGVYGKTNYDISNRTTSGFGGENLLL